MARPARGEAGGGRLARREARRFMEHAYWYAVLLCMLHCMPLRPEEERLCIMGHAY